MATSVGVATAVGTSQRVYRLQQGGKKEFMELHKFQGLH